MYAVHYNGEFEVFGLTQLVLARHAEVISNECSVMTETLHSFCGLIVLFACISAYFGGTYTPTVRIMPAFCLQSQYKLHTVVLSTTT